MCRKETDMWTSSFHGWRKIHRNTPLTELDRKKVGMFSKTPGERYSWKPLQIHTICHLSNSSKINQPRHVAMMWWAVLWQSWLSLREIRSWQEIISDDLCWQEATASWPATTPNLTNDLSICRKLFRRNVLILCNLLLLYDLQGSYILPLQAKNWKATSQWQLHTKLDWGHSFSKHWKRKRKTGSEKFKQEILLLYY